MRGILKKVMGNKNTFFIYILGIWIIIGYAFLNNNLENSLKLMSNIALAGLTASIAVIATIISLVTLNENRKLREKVLRFCALELPTFLFLTIGIIGYANIEPSVFSTYDQKAKEDLRKYIFEFSEEPFKKMFLVIFFILCAITNSFMLLNFKKISWEIYINYAMENKSIENSEKTLNNKDVCIKTKIEYDEEMVRVISSKKT